MRSSLEVGDDDDDAADDAADNCENDEEGNAEFSEFETGWRGDGNAFSARRASMCMCNEPDKVVEKNGADEADADDDEVDDRDNGAPNKTRTRLRCDCC